MQTLFTRFALLGLGLLSSMVYAETATDMAAPDAEAAVAAEPIYQVEFIVVRPRHRDDLQAEDWPSERPTLASDALTAGAGAPAQPLESSAGFSWVQEGSWDFPNTLRRLQESGAYEVLMHRSWRQPATPRKNAVPYVVKLPLDGRDTALSVNDYSDSDLAANNDKAGLVGTVAFGKARYLHFTVDLLLSEAAANANNNWQGNDVNPAAADRSADSLGLQRTIRPPLQHFHLQETRRIQPEKTQYFDHPGFAVLAHVRRL